MTTLTRLLTAERRLFSWADKVQWPWLSVLGALIVGADSLADFIGRLV